MVIYKHVIKYDCKHMMDIVLSDDDIVRDCL